MGYHVGSTNGQPRHLRRAILKEIVEGVLPPVHSAEYMAEWGEQRSPQRLQKLAETLAALTRNEKRRRDQNLDRAIMEREEDLAFLYDEYYVGKFHFGWPSTYLHDLPQVTARPSLVVTESTMRA